VSPGVLGRVVVTDGQLVFFGNTYTVNTGTINFYDPNSIQPVINIGLETLAQGVDVNLNVSGPMDNLQLSYTSDPPLSFEQIVELLATNTTPNDPNIVANQPPSPQQSTTQMGESAILGQAVADPLASRVQRVFGLSEFKIDPSVSGTNGQPGARVTLQQKIANNITFTYSEDTTQSNAEIIRVQWDLTPKLSAVGLRDYNSDVSIELYYKFKVR
jgi:translocation and assembly module TamB